MSGPKQTQAFKLWQVLSTGEPVTVKKLEEVLGVGQYSVPVYIHELKRVYKADIESVREGRRVTAYRLCNKIKVPEFRSNNAQYVAPKKPVAPVVTEEEHADPDEISDREMDDIKSQLGIDSLDDFDLGDIE